MLTYHEWYGELPVSTLRLIRKYNVSPSDYTMIIDSLGVPTWKEIEGFIIEHSVSGCFRFPF